MPTKTRILTLLAFGVAGYLLFAGLGAPPLVQPDEGRNAEIAREMKVSGHWLIPTHDGVVHLDKPAFFFKAVGLALSAFGENEFAARFPNAFFAFTLLVMTYFFVRHETNERCAALAVLVTGTTPLFFAYARLVIVDMTLAWFVCGAIYAGYLAESTEGAARKRWSLLGAALSGVATLVKGPVGFILPTLVLLIFHRLAGHRGAWKRHLAPTNLALFFALVLPWFLGVVHQQPDFAYYGLIEETFHRYTTNQFHRHEPVWFFPAIIAGTFLAWSVLLPESVVAAWRSRKQWTRLDKLCVAWSISLLIFFSLSHSKRAGYVLTLAVSLGILTARVLDLALGGASERAARILARGTGTLAAVAGAVGALFLAGLASPGTMTRVLHLHEEMQPFLRASLTAMAIALFAIAIVGVVALWRRDARVSVAAFVLLPVLLGTAAFPAIQRDFEQHSARALARQIPRLPDVAEVACIRFFEEGMPFYLGRTVTILTRDGRELKSNYTLFRIRQGREWPPQLIPYDDAETWLASRTDSVYLLCQKNQRELLERVAGARGVPVKRLGANCWGALLPPAHSR